MRADLFNEPGVGSLEQRQELIDRLLELKNNGVSDINAKSSNYGCWRLMNPITDCEWLNKKLTDMILEAIAFYTETQYSNIVEYKHGETNINIRSWANINEPGSRNVYHAHKGSHFSACFYLQATDTGDLVLSNPSNILGECNNFAPYARAFVFKPKDGDLILWPAWVPHEIETNLSDKQRINIAFDITIGDDKF